MGEGTGADGLHAFAGCGARAHHGALLHPSGRLIQRDYRSLEDYFAPADDDETVSTEPGTEGAEVPVGETYYTDGGRKVFGGGGIHPAVRVPLDDLTKTAELLERKSAFFEFATRYRAAHSQPPDEATFEVIPELLAQFRAYLVERQVEVKDADFAENEAYIRRGIKAEIYSNYFGLVPRNRVLAEGDRQLQEALRLFPEAERLTALRAAAEPASPTRRPGLGAHPGPHLSPRCGEGAGQRAVRSWGPAGEGGRPCGSPVRGEASTSAGPTPATRGRMRLARCASLGGLSF